MLRLIRTGAVSVLIVQLVLRFATQFGYIGMEIASITDLCLLCLVVTTSYMGLAGDKISASRFRFPGR